MVSDFSYLRDLYPPVITLDQLYRICHLSKMAFGKPHYSLPGFRQKDPPVQDPAG